ncbi:hypothetical protein [Catenovulum maritimum]|uniref:Uncharacterized protein n=1 Tax=Catenovulum maritimum TaxID=1513271 RepID=A0A0J8GV26_9ALTE|nr:hypothetical protein [Catenovulum maritimum]KMT66587.1 hypothetical protein XM47_03385 [Catenovulum maritimum]
MKKLSICLFGRNDNYTPDFLYRITTTINFIAHSLSKIGCLNACEVVVADWKSECPLHQVMDLSENAQLITRFFHFEPTDISKNGIPACSLINFAFDKSNSEYVAFCGADTIIPSSTFRAIFDVLDEKSLISEPSNKYFNCGRYKIPSSFVNTQPDISSWERYLRMRSWQLEKSPAYGGFLYGGAGLLMFHKNLISEIGGLDKKLDYGWGWNDIELTLRFMFKNEWYDLHSCGALVYDMEHEPTGGRVDAIKVKPDHKIPKAYTSNDAQWATIDNNYQVYKSSKKCSNEVLSSDETRKRSIAVVSNSEIQAVERFKFELSSTNYKGISTSNAETKASALIATLFKDDRLSCLIDVDSLSGFSGLFASSLYKDTELYVLEEWNIVDDITGPHNLSAILYSSLIKHRGYLRVINSKTSQAWKDVKVSVDTQWSANLIICRKTDSFINLFNDFLNTLNPNGYILYINETEAEIDKCIEHVRKNSTLDYKVNKANGLLLISNPCDGIIEFTDSKNTLSLPTLPEQSNYSMVVNLINRLESYSSEDKFILYGVGTISKLVLPILKGKIVACIDKKLSFEGVKVFEGIKVITAEEIKDYPNTSVLITPINHIEEILSELSDHSDNLVRLHF